MRHITLTLLFTLILSGMACAGLPAAIPSGSWNYALLVNGVRAGSAHMSNRKEGETYIITSELDINLAGMRNISRQVVTETTAFTPVKLETTNKIKTADGWKDIQTTALFRGTEVEIRSGGRSTSITLPEGFVLDGNYFISKLIEERFKEGLLLKGAIYDPSIELDSLIPVTVAVMGRKTVDVAGKKRKLLHISQSIEAIKSADTYLDENGVMIKAAVQMMNLTVELILE